MIATVLLKYIRNELNNAPIIFGKLKCVIADLCGKYYYSLYKVSGRMP